MVQKLRTRRARLNIVHVIVDIPESVWLADRPAFYPMTSRRQLQFASLFFASNLQNSVSTPGSQSAKLRFTVPSVQKCKKRWRQLSDYFQRVQLFYSSNERRLYRTSSVLRNNMIELLALNSHQFLRPHSTTISCRRSSPLVTPRFNCRFSNFDLSKTKSNNFIYGPYNNFSHIP